MILLIGFILFTEDQGSKLSCIVLCVDSIAMAHSLHPFDPCSLYTFSLLCLMKQNALHSLHWLCLISTSVILNSNIVILHYHTVCALLQCNIGGGHGVLLVEALKLLWYDNCIAS
jgi:hypothetical protein